MRLASRLVRMFSPLKRDASGGRGWLGAWSSRSVTGIDVNQATALMAVPVMSCVTIISEDVSNLTPMLYRRQPDGSKQLATDHYVYQLLYRPNAWQTWGEFCQQMLIGFMLRGNAYAVMLRDRGGRVVAFVPINPDFVALWEAPDGSLWWRVTRNGLHQLAVLRNVPLMIPYEDVMHWKGLSANGLVGLSKIAMNREAIALSLGQEQMAARAMGSGARPSGTLNTDKALTPEAAKRLAEDWERVHSGLLNGGKTAVLEQGLKWTPLTLNLADLEFLAARNFQIADIARLWRVPLHMLNAETGKGTGQSIDQRAQEYLNFTLRTYIRTIQDRLAFSLDLPRDVIVELDVTELIKADLSARFQAYRLALQGWATVNDVRKAEGMTPSSDEMADKIFRPVNMAPLDSDVFMGADLDAEPGAGNGLGSDQGGDNPGAGAPGKGKPDPDKDPEKD